MTLTRRSFFRGAATGALIVAAAPILPAPAIARVVTSPGIVPMLAPVGPDGWAQMLGAVRNGIYTRVYPIMRFDQFVTRHDELFTRARPRPRLSPNRRRSYFDFGGLMSRCGIIPPRGPTLNTMPPP